MTHSNANNALVFDQDAKQILKLGLLLGAISALASLSLILGFLSSVPFIYAYYKHGEKVFWTAGIFALGVLLLINIFSERNVTDINTIVESVPLESLEQNGFNENTTLANEFMGSNTYILYLLFSYSMRLVGVWAIVKLSAFSWIIRLIAAMLIITIGIFPILTEAKELTLSMFQFQELDSQLISKLMYYFVPVVTGIMLIYNWIVSTLILSARSKTNYNLYLEYVFSKILSQNIKIPNIVSVILAIAIWLTRNSTQGGIYIINIILTAILFVFALMFSVIGASYLYFYVQRKTGIRSLWYLFFVCIIIIVPFINIPIISVLLVIGLWVNWKLPTHTERSNNESNT